MLVYTGVSQPGIATRRGPRVAHDTGCCCATPPAPTPFPAAPAAASDAPRLCPPDCASRTRPAAPNGEPHWPSRGTRRCTPAAAAARAPPPPRTPDRRGLALEEAAARRRRRAARLGSPPPWPPKRRRRSPKLRLITVGCSTRAAAVAPSAAAARVPCGERADARTAGSPRRRAELKQVARQPRAARRFVRAPPPAPRRAPTPRVSRDVRTAAAREREREEDWIWKLRHFLGDCAHEILELG